MEYLVVLGLAALDSFEAVKVVTLRLMAPVSPPWFQSLRHLAPAGLPLYGSAQQDSAAPAVPGFGDLACAPVKRPAVSTPCRLM